MVQKQKVLAEPGMYKESRTESEVMGMEGLQSSGSGNPAHRTVPV